MKFNDYIFINEVFPLITFIKKSNIPIIDLLILLKRINNRNPEIVPELINVFYSLISEQFPEELDFYQDLLNIMNKV